MKIMAKVDCNVFLSESESRNLSLLYHFEGDSTSSTECECQELIKAKILTKIVINLHEVKSVIFINFHEIQLSLTLSS